ncbi:MAG: phosphoribosylformylglycinamidine cyclo-ligase [Acidobacteria bacterium]|nr:MAG: phosphoribosylformylglycinamidine cyclo-ligase [Acidobacteriota bacterium]
MVEYKDTGVDRDKKEAGLTQLLEYVNRTFRLNRCAPLLPIGYFANVIDLTPAGFPIGIAFSTDGVGTKLLIAERLGKYDTVGIDCVAMNVNDILCVGATPVSMVDYIAVSEANRELLSELGKGLFKGCEQAEVSLSGGEIAQVAELLAKKENQISFDVVGTAIGTVATDKIIVGKDLKEGDRVIGLESSGLHSNGYTLARKVCFEIGKLAVNDYVPELGRTIGEEMLIPTRIYVKEILRILKKTEVKALFHITGGGFFNMVRTQKAVGFRIEHLPQPPQIFQFIQRIGKITNEEMFRVFNMGVGFIVVVPDDSAAVQKVQEVAKSAGYSAHYLGVVTNDRERKIILEPYGLRGEAGQFSRVP